MAERTSTAEHEYAGRALKAGDRFDVLPEHVKLLLAMGRIEPQRGEAGYHAPKREALQAAVETTPTPAQAAEDKKGNYKASTLRLRTKAA